MRLHLRLVLLVAIAAGPALGLLVYSQSAYHANRVAQVQRKAQQLAQSATIHTEARIHSLRQVLSGLGALLPQFEQDPALCAQTASELRSGFGTVSFAAVSYGGGNLRCGDADAVAALSGGPERLSSPPDTIVSYFREFRTTQPTGLFSVTFAEPVTLNGEIVGTIMANASVGWLTEGLGHLPLGQDAIVMLVDRDGYVLARRPDSAAWIGRRVPDEVAEAIRSRRLDGTQKILGVSDHPMVAAAVPIPSLTDSLFILAGLDRSAEFSPIRRAQFIDLAVLGLLIIAIVATALMSWHTAGSLVSRERGLSEAKAAAERLAEGQQRIADTIGHDLRNSVQTLVSFLRNLRRHGDRPPDPSMLPYVARAIGDLRSALDVLVRASRLESNALEPQKRAVELASFFKKIASDWQFFAETKGLQLKFTAGRECVDSDPDLLRTIVSNLVSNAIKHTATGGVHVSTRTEPDGRIAIVVRDTGKGVPPDKAKVIFDAFSRLEPEKTEGLGLGLSICKRSADLLGCELSLDSHTEGGACFVIVVPAATTGRKTS